MNNLKRKLEYHYKKFDASQIYPDPLIFPHRFAKESDIEISAFISSIFAYGNVTQILNSLERVHTLFGESPTEYFANFNPKDHKVFFKANNLPSGVYVYTLKAGYFFTQKKILLLKKNIRTT